MVGWCDGAGLTSSAGASYNFDVEKITHYVPGKEISFLSTKNGVVGWCDGAG